MSIYAKVKTGIPGLDSIVSGGLKQGRSIVVSGSPGSGKTTFGLQFLHVGAKDFDEPGVFITLAQNVEDIKNDCKSYGWDFNNLISKDKILMIDARPFKLNDQSIGKDDSLYRGEQIPFEHLTKLILNSIKRIDAKRIVIDSITVLEMQYSDAFYIRQGLQGLVQALENYGVTSILLSEVISENQISPEWFVSSGVIQLRHTRKQDTMERSIQVIKLRGVRHSDQIHLVELNDEGLRVMHPRFAP
ncbi:MAG: ATPase domain-containing protein [Nitrosarchaeum sp.]|jgi:KaiC/GvpD/RAD55 family RecA-like ATPase|uniref:RAD55 family ATPase n=1 Tax=Nitrosarchaeum sp. TaxID=2026886 RepID=UPI002DF3AE91|nr:ATPase domain-containing protein [Nitrosarchaeum sp.]